MITKKICSKCGKEVSFYHDNKKKLCMECNRFTDEFGRSARYS